VDKKNTFIKKAGGVVSGALLIMAIFWFITNFSVLKNAESRTCSPITSDEAVILENTDGSAYIGFHNETGVYINKLRFDIEARSERPAAVDIIVRCLENDSDIKEYVFKDINPLYVRHETVNINKANITEIEIKNADNAKINSETAAKETAAQFTVRGFEADNRLMTNGYVLLFAALFGAAFSSVILFKGVFFKKPEYALLIIGISMGLSMLSGLPSTKVGYDEETHMQSVFAIAAIPSGELHFNDAALNQVLITEYNNPGALPGSEEESKELYKTLSAECDYRTGDNTPTFKLIPSRVPAYLMMAAGVKAAKLFHPGWSTLIFVMRLSNLIMYTAMMFAAVRLVPKAKWLMLFIALLPQNIFMACTCSYDPFVIGCISIAYALMLKGRRYIIPMAVFFILGCLPKAVYAPVLLIGIAVSLFAESDEKKSAVNAESENECTDCHELKRRAEAKKRAEKKKRIGIILLGAFVFVGFIALFILPTVIAPEDTGDLRGGEVSALRQVKFILSEPLTYTAILLRQMKSWFRQCWFGADCMTFMGHIVSGYSEFKGYYVPYLIMLTAGIVLSHDRKHFTENDVEGESFLSLPLRMFTLLMVFAASALVWTAMYVAFTVPGAPEIAGVQGRYFIPLMFPAYLSLCGAGDILSPSNGGFIARKTALCYYLLELFILALTVWRCVIAAFCR